MLTRTFSIDILSIAAGCASPLQFPNMRRTVLSTVASLSACGDA